MNNKPYPQKRRDPDKDESWFRYPCMHPSHNPPTLIYIPAGQTKTHICPACGQETIMNGGSVHWC